MKKRVCSKPNLIKYTVAILPLIYHGEKDPFDKPGDSGCLITRTPSPPGSVARSFFRMST